MKFFTHILATVIFFLVGLSAFASDTAYDDILKAGKEEFSDGNYERATRYFQIAQQLDDTSQEPRYYINLIQRMKDNSVVLPREQTPPSYTKKMAIDAYLDTVTDKGVVSDVSDNNRESVIDSMLDSVGSEISTGNEVSQKIEVVLSGENEKPAIAVMKQQTVTNTKQIKSTASVSESLTKVEEKITATPKASDEEKTTSPAATAVSEPIKRQTRPTAQAVEKVINLSTSYLKDFPMAIDIFIDQSVVIKSARIKRWLVVSDGVVDTQRLDASSLRVVGKSLGPTILHVWDDTGRWTFSFHVVSLTYFDQKSAQWDKPKGFKFFYENNWRSYYDGPSISSMERSSVIFDQSAGLEGSTPYGNLDSSAQWSYVSSENKIKGYTIGLSDGHFFIFDRFNIRGFDFSQAFSPLTFPGTTLRGGYFNSPMFGDGLDYTLIWGSDKRSYGYLTSSLISDQDSYIQGAQVRLFPKAKHSVALNYIEGYGADRESYLKDKAYSVETKHAFGVLNAINEIASDEDKSAATSVWNMRTKNSSWRASYRNIAKDYLTISGRPSNSAEVGGTFGVDWRPITNLSLNSDLDVYRDRENYNDGYPDGLNYDWNGGASLSLSPTSSLNSNIFYSNDAQLSFPQRNLSANATYNKSFNLQLFGKRSLSTYASYSYQKSINPLSPISDYRRDAVTTGMRLGLMNGLYGYTNYTYSWVRDILTGVRTNPTVWEAGLDYYRNFTSKFSTNLRVYYRNEDNVESVHSFLAGEDSAEASVSLSYSPYTGVQFFCDGRLRRIWPEDGANSFEGDVRLGTRLEWDSFITWSPLVTISGIVYKDSNGNGKLDKGEAGIGGITIMVGPLNVKTDDNGKYKATIRAHNASATIDMNSLPKGYIATTNTSVKLNTSRDGDRRVDFGISSQSGIYGLVFCDENGDGKFTKGEQSISKAKISLDGKLTVSSNGEGAYFFGSLLSGKHTISLDVNSLPLDYIPSAQIRQQITVEEGSTYAVYFPLKKR